MCFPLYFYLRKSQRFYRLSIAVIAILVPINAAAQGVGIVFKLRYGTVFMIDACVRRAERNTKCLRCILQEHNLLTLSHNCLAGLSASSVELLPVPSIIDFERRMAALGKPPNHPMMSPKWHDMSPVDSFAIMFEVDGQEIGGVAARCLDLGEDALAKHWQETYSRMYTNGETSPVSGFSGAASREIRGRVVYLGELFLAEGWRKGVVDWRLVFHYLFALSYLKWRSDWIYGFVRQQDVMRGKASRYGFTRQYVGPQTWTKCVERRSSQEYLVAISRQDLFDAAAFYSASPEDLRSPAT